MNVFEEPSKVQDLLATAPLQDFDERHAIRNDPRQYAIDKGIITEDSDVEVKLVVSESGTLHIPLMHTDIGHDIGANELQRIQGGAKCTGTAGCATTASTLSSVTASLSSMSSASTAGTAGSG